jgi:hypothetical protein
MSKLVNLASFLNRFMNLSSNQDVETLNEESREIDAPLSIFLKFPCNRRLLESNFSKLPENEQDDFLQELMNYLYNYLYVIQFETESIYTVTPREEKRNLDFIKSILSDYIKEYVKNTNSKLEFIFFCIDFFDNFYYKVFSYGIVELDIYDYDDYRERNALVAFVYSAFWKNPKIVEILRKNSSFSIVDSYYSIPIHYCDGYGEQDKYDEIFSILGMGRDLKRSMILTLVEFSHFLSEHHKSK